MNTLLKTILGIIVATVVTVGIAASAYASGVDVIEGSCNAAGGSPSALCEDAGTPLFGDGSIFQRITNAFLFVVGAVSVIMIVVGGFRYAISNGDQSAMTSAKNTIFYAIVGLVVAIAAYAIVSFVLTYV